MMIGGDGILAEILELPREDRQMKSKGDLIFFRQWKEGHGMDNPDFKQRRESVSFRQRRVIIGADVEVFDEAIIDNFRDEEGVIDTIPLQVSFPNQNKIIIFSEGVSQSKDIDSILETTSLRVSYSPHSKLLVGGLVSPQTAVLEPNASGGNNLEVTPVQLSLYDRELLDRVADTEWDSASSRLLPRRSARLKAKKLAET
ncbi:unnamed protein product [Cuscuta epithymum]|uniref:Uncharacterized protein n=1 Tax=Cuscuta epithymum TaxID=186058 RepID=A0AAV0FGC2_9ASTE|nr:unnamed protein product [Cuscuta epithymum]